MLKDTPLTSGVPFIQMQYLTCEIRSINFSRGTQVEFQIALQLRADEFLDRSEWCDSFSIAVPLSLEFLAAIQFISSLKLKYGYCFHGNNSFTLINRLQMYYY